MLNPSSVRVAFGLKVIFENFFFHYLMRKRMECTYVNWLLGKFTQPFNYQFLNSTFLFTSPLPLSFSISISHSHSLSHILSLLHLHSLSLPISLFSYLIHLRVEQDSCSKVNRLFYAKSLNLFMIYFIFLKFLYVMFLNQV